MTCLNNLTPISLFYSTTPNFSDSPLFKKGEAFANLEFDCKVLNLPSDVHYLNRIARIIYNPDLSLSKRQFYVEENLLNYYNDHFVELINSNPENFKYSELSFKLFHEYYPKFIKLSKTYLKTDSFSRKPNLKILSDLKVETIASNTFVIIISSISSGVVSFVTLSLDLGKSIRVAQEKITLNLLTI